MDENLMDNILMALGGLSEKRKNRSESEQSVGIVICGSADRCYPLKWRTGNMLDIFATTNAFKKESSIPLASIYLNADGLYFGRQLAIMIYGIITGYDKVLRFGV